MSDSLRITYDCKIIMSLVLCLDGTAIYRIMTAWHVVAPTRPIADHICMISNVSYPPNKSQPFASNLCPVSKEARIVFNTGQAPDERYFAFSPPAEVLGFENYYKT